MKKLSLLLILLFIFIAHSFAQGNIRTDKYRTLQTGIFFYDGTVEWGDTDILVTITTKNYVITKVNIYAQKEEQYDVIGMIDTYTDSNNISWGVFDCLNSNNERYKLHHGIFNNSITGHVFTLKFTNSDGNGLIYKLKRN